MHCRRLTILFYSLELHTSHNLGKALQESREKQDLILQENIPAYKDTNGEDETKEEGTTD